MSMHESINRISFKLLLLVLLMLLLLGGATAVIVARSFRTAQREVMQRSADGLQAQGEVADCDCGWCTCYAPLFHIPPLRHVHAGVVVVT